MSWSRTAIHTLIERRITALKPLAKVIEMRTETREETNFVYAIAQTEFSEWKKTLGATAAGVLSFALAPFTAGLSLLAGGAVGAAAYNVFETKDQHFAYMFGLQRINKPNQIELNTTGQCERIDNVWYYTELLKETECRGFREAQSKYEELQLEPKLEYMNRLSNEVETILKRKTNIYRNSKFSQCFIDFERLKEILEEIQGVQDCRFYKQLILARAHLF